MNRYRVINFVGQKYTPVYSTDDPYLLAQAVSAEDELGALQGEHARLTEQLALREEVLKQLEEKTAHLKQQHLEALDDVCGFSVYSVFLLHNTVVAVLVVCRSVGHWCQIFCCVHIVRVLGWLCGWRC